MAGYQTIDTSPRGRRRPGFPGHAVRKRRPSSVRVIKSALSRPVTMNLTINGERREFPAPLTVAGLLEQLGLAGKRIAVEMNGEIVPKSRHGETPVGEGDRFEIVVAVGGG